MNRWLNTNDLRRRASIPIFTSACTRSCGRSYVSPILASVPCFGIGRYVPLASNEHEIRRATNSRLEFAKQ
jgi:hypothetical protein